MRTSFWRNFFFFSLCLVLCTNQLLGWKAKSLPAGFVKQSCCSRPTALTPSGYWAQCLLYAVELVQPISPRNQWEVLCFQANISSGEAGQALMPFAIQTTCDCFILSWAASWAEPARVHSPRTCWVSPSPPINTSEQKEKWFCSLPSSDIREMSPHLSL